MTNLNLQLDEKLALKPKIDEISNEFIRIANLGVLKFGRISISYLMRKLKCSDSMAKDILCQVERMKL